MWGSLATGNDTTRFVMRPGSSLLGRLDGIAKAFELYRVLAFRVTYEPSAGANTNGSVIMSIDYDVEDNDPSLDAIRAQVPNVRCQVSRQARLVLGPRELEKINRTKWLYTAAGTGSHPGMDSGFALNCWSAKSAISPGDIYAEYVIEFTNPRITTSPAKLDVKTANQYATVGVKGEIPASGFVPTPLSNTSGSFYTGNTIVDAASDVLGYLQARPTAVANLIARPGFLNSDDS
jgi:hypothetical protein